MSKRVEIDEAIKEAMAIEKMEWISPIPDRAGGFRWLAASNRLVALRAAKARGETHVEEE